jgi:hypothetical protein
MKRSIGKLAVLFLTTVSMSAHAQKNEVVYKTPQYTVYRDSIVQGAYVARALSSGELTSDYKSPANEFKSPVINFKFSINGKDNEMRSGIDHHFACLAKNGSCETPLIKFGSQLNAGAATGYLAPNTDLKIRLDMRDVLQAFKTQGYYTTFKGEKIYQADFKGVYVAGSAAPLIWDFDNLVNHPQLQLHDDDGDGIYEVTLKLNAHEDEKESASSWKRSRDLSAFPAYASDYPISDALYNLAIEEMIRAVEPDSTFRTGKEWSGVWTRDISYSIILSMAHLQPGVARNSLLRKVNQRKSIIQDTGTGGAWPVSTDRMIWAVAAWELYKSTGDRDWLAEAYTIIKNSIEDDLHTIYDQQTGLVKGESSFLDWREQTYPKWMQPADIFESECLGTNAVHYEANIVLSRMATLLNKKETAARHLAIAARIKKGINDLLWLPEKKYYGQFLYGRNFKILSPRSEALGEALCVLFGIAEGDRKKQVVVHTPVTAFGISCIYPQIPDIPPYHNNAVWPFVQSFWLWASGEAANERSVLESMAAIYRPAAMFLTNKENFVAGNGDFLGTQINSSNMLWSLSGSIGIVHKFLFGIKFLDDRLAFQPFVPQAWKGQRSLTNFQYRESVLDIEMEGYGNRIARFMIDDQQKAVAEIPATLKGRHRVKIILANNMISPQPVNKLANYTSLPAPDPVYKDGKLQWQKNGDAKKFKVLRNGKLLQLTDGTSLSVPKNSYAEYQVIAVDRSGYESFASEPVVVAPDRLVLTYEAEAYLDKAAYDYRGYSGNGFVEISQTVNKTVAIPVTVREAGVYAIDFRYANGNGPTNTENKCAIRSLKVDGNFAGTSLFPQRGKEEWSNWGFSNANKVYLTKGSHVVSLVYEDWNENMNGTINQAMIDYLRLVMTEASK